MNNPILSELPSRASRSSFRNRSGTIWNALFSYQGTLGWGFFPDVCSGPEDPGALVFRASFAILSNTSCPVNTFFEKNFSKFFRAKISIFRLIPSSTRYGGFPPSRSPICRQNLSGRPLSPGENFLIFSLFTRGFAGTDPGHRPSVSQHCPRYPPARQRQMRY